MTPHAVEFGGQRVPMARLERVRHILEADPAHRVHIVSFPKSGRTWCRVMLSRYKQRLFGIPEFHLYLHRLYSAGPKPAPQILFSHGAGNYPTNRKEARWFYLRKALGWEMDTVAKMDISHCKGAKVVFVVRDPRDVVLSYYHHRSKRLPSYRFPGSASEFLRDRHFGIGHLVAFMNFLVVQAARHEHMFLFYEDMRQDVTAEMEKLIRFAGLHYDDEALRDAVDYGSFDNMKRLEAQGSYGKELRQRIAGDPNSLKVRKGIVGGYKEELTAEDVAYLDERIRARLDPFYRRYLPQS